MHFFLRTHAYVIWFWIPALTIQMQNEKNFNIKENLRIDYLQGSKFTLEQMIGNNTWANETKKENHYQKIKRNWSRRECKLVYVCACALCVFKRTTNTFFFFLSQKLHVCERYKNKRIFFYSFKFIIQLFCVIVCLYSLRSSFGKYNAEKYKWQ